MTRDTGGFLPLTRIKILDILAQLGYDLRVHTIGLQDSAGLNLTHIGGERVVKTYLDGAYRGSYAMWLDYRVQVNDEKGAREAVDRLNTIGISLARSPTFSEGSYRGVTYRVVDYPLRTTPQEAKNMMVYRIKIEANYDYEEA
jgi:hypothetical protein